MVVVSESGDGSVVVVIPVMVMCGGVRQMGSEPGLAGPGIAAASRLYAA